MEKRGRKRLPEELKKEPMTAFLTKRQKALIISKYGSLTEAILHEILQKLQADGHSNSPGNREPMAR